MSGVVDIGDRAGADVRWLSTLSCTPDSCSWMDWGHQVKVALNVHAPITSQAHEWLRCSTTKKTESKGKDAAATAATLWFFPSPEIDSNSHQVKCLPLPGVASQFLPKNRAWSSEFAPEAGLASPHCSTPSPAVRCQVWDPFTPQVSLFGQGYNM